MLKNFLSLHYFFNPSERWVTPVVCRMMMMPETPSLASIMKRAHDCPTPAAHRHPLTSSWFPPSLRLINSLSLLRTLIFFISNSIFFQSIHIQKIKIKLFIIFQNCGTQQRVHYYYYSEKKSIVENFKLNSSIFCLLF